MPTYLVTVTLTEPWTTVLILRLFITGGCDAQTPETNNFHVAHLKFASNQNIQNISSSILRLDSHKWNQMERIIVVINYYWTLPSFFTQKCLLFICFLMFYEFILLAPRLMLICAFSLTPGKGARPYTSTAEPKPASKASVVVPRTLEGSIVPLTAELMVISQRNSWREQFAIKTSTLLQK